MSSSTTTDVTDYVNMMEQGDLFSGNISSSDTLGNMVSEIFGDGWAEIGKEALFGGTSDSASMIVAVLGAFNVVVMNAGAIILIWLAFQATMGTAHEGQFLGKRFHDYWMPIRSGLSITLLAPVVKGGLCIVQVLVLLSIGVSIQMSNFLQTAGLTYILNHNGRTVSVSAPPEMQENAKQLAAGLLEVAIIQEHYRLNQKKPIQEPGYNVTSTDPYTIEFIGPRIWWGRQQNLAVVKVPNYETSSGIDVARANQVIVMYGKLKNLATAIITNATSEYEDLPIDKNIYEDSIDDYLANVSPHLDALLSEENPDYQTELKKFVEKANSDGVFWLGTYYHTIARYSARLYSIAGDFPAYTAGNIEPLEGDVNILLEAAIATKNSMLQEFEEREAIVRSNTGSGPVKQFFNELTYSAFGIGGFGTLTQWFIAVTSKGDPMANLADTGHLLMGAAETVMFTYIGSVGIAAGAEDFTGKGVTGFLIGFTGAGKVAQAFTKGFSAILKQLGPFVLTMILPVFILGVFLGIYLPLIPFITWMSAMLGCIIVWIELIVLSPIWTLTLASGEGEGLAGQRSQQGIILGLNAVLRLPLMTLGFLIATVLMPLFAKAVGYAFCVVIASTSSEHTFGLPTAIAYWFIYGGFIILQAHTLFGLTTHLTDNVMKFFGGALSSMGEAQQEAKTRAILMHGAGKAESAGQSALGRQRKDPDSGNTGGEQQAIGRGAGQQNMNQNVGSMDLGEK